MNATRRTFVAAMAGGIAASSVPSGVSAQQKMPVVATFTILGDLVANVGGDRIALTTIVGPDQDAHAHPLTPNDARAVAGAKVLVLNGMNFEPWADRLARSVSFGGVRVVATDGLKDTLTRSADEHGHGHGQGHVVTSRTAQRRPQPVSDPHAFQDVTGARLYVANIARGLAAADPANAAYYRDRAGAYDARLAELDGWIKARIGTIPAAKRKVVTGHDAFQYFGRAYGVTFVAPTGVSTEEQPSARDVAKLIEQIRAEGIAAIFMENMTAPQLIQRVAAETGVTLGPKLYVDALSGPSGPADTYEKMMRHNVPALVAGMARNR